MKPAYNTHGCQTFITHSGLPDLHITLRVAKTADHTQGFQTSISLLGLSNLNITLRVAKPPYHTQGCQTSISHSWLPKLSIPLRVCRFYLKPIVELFESKLTYIVNMIRKCNNHKWHTNPCPMRLRHKNTDTHIKAQIQLALSSSLSWLLNYKGHKERHHKNCQWDYKKKSCSTQLSMKFQLLIKAKMLKNNDFSSFQTLSWCIDPAYKC